MLQLLLEEQTMLIKVSCRPDDVSTSRKSAQSFLLLPCTLEVTVYGTQDLLDEDIGVWFQDYDVYLQDPQVFHFEARYCNPQKLESVDLNCCPMVSDVVSKKPGLVMLDIEARPGFLDALTNQIELEEAPQPRALRTDLLR